MNNLKKIRKEKGVTQDQIARYLNISRAAYTNIENGKRDPDSQTMIRLADYYGVSVDELLGRITSYEAGTLAGLELDERRMLIEYRKLNDTGKIKAFEFIVMARNTYPADQDGGWDSDPVSRVENQK